MTWSAFLAAIRSGAPPRVAQTTRRAATGPARSPAAAAARPAAQDGAGLRQEAAAAAEASPSPLNEWEANVLALDVSRSRRFDIGKHWNRLTCCAHSKKSFVAFC